MVIPQTILMVVKVNVKCSKRIKTPYLRRILRMAGELISSASYDFCYFYLHFANVQGNGRMGAT
jgi:hypothetical protein